MSNFIRTQPFNPNTTILIQELIINTIDALITSHNTGRLQVDGTNQMTGTLKCGPTGTTAGSGGEIRLIELAANGAEYIGFRSPDSVTTSKIWTLPATDGAAGQFIRTDGAGVLSWNSAVTSVGLAAPAEFTVTGSPVTGAGTLTIGKVSQAANLVYAGPGSGPAAAPVFRTLVAADIPSLDASKVTTGVFSVALGGTGLSTLGTALQVLRVNAGATALEYATASIGTVTSVGLSAPSVLSVTGSPVTTSGTLALAFAGGQLANQVLASPNGVAGAVGLRALVAADIPALDASKITTGILGVAQIPVLDGTKISASSVVQMARVGFGQAADSTAVMAATGQYFSTQAAQTTTGASPVIIINWNNSNCHKVTLSHTGTATVSLTNPKIGGRYVIEFAQDVTGGRLVNYAITGVKYSGGTTPAQTTTANKEDVLAFYYDGTDYIGSSTLNH